MGYWKDRAEDILEAQQLLFPGVKPRPGEAERAAPKKKRGYKRELAAYEAAHRELLRAKRGEDDEDDPGTRFDKAARNKAEKSWMKAHDALHLAMAQAGVDISTASRMVRKYEERIERELEKPAADKLIKDMSDSFRKSRYFLRVKYYPKERTWSGLMRLEKAASAEKHRFAVVLKSAAKGYSGRPEISYSVPDLGLRGTWNLSIRYARDFANELLELYRKKQEREKKHEREQQDPTRWMKSGPRHY